MRAFVFFLCLLCLSPAGADAGPGELSGEAAAAFAWFDTLGYPDVRECPFVRVATGRPDRVDAFLLAREPDGGFRVLTLDLGEESYRPTPPDTDPARMVGYEPADLAAAADALAARLGEKGTYRGDDTRDTPHFSNLRAVGFVLGWACARHGLDERANQLYRLTARASHLPSSSSLLAATEADPGECRTALQNDLAVLEMWRAVLAAATVPRPASRDAFAWIAHLFPFSGQADRARVLAGTLDVMIAEDHAHPAVDDPARLPVEARVAEWIFRLRDQTGHVDMSPGMCSVFSRFAPPGTTPDTAARHLAALGYAAVPQLIEALADPHLSRAVDCNGRDHFFSHRVFTVGDCAKQVLEAIAGRDFRPPGDPWRYVGDGDHLTQIRHDVLEWWAQLQTRGEKEALAQEVAAATGWKALALGYKLLERYPDAAFGPLRQATEHSAADDFFAERGLLVTMTALAPSNDLVPFLREEMRVGIDHPEAYKKSPFKDCIDPVADTRIAAAYALWNHGEQDEAFPVLTAEWRHLPTGVESGRGEWLLQSFLAHCGRAEAVDALGQDLRRRSGTMQRQVLDQLFPDEKNARHTYSVSFAQGEAEWQVDYRVAPTTEKNPEAWTRAVERLLISELDNATASASGYAPWLQGTFPKDIETGDVAAYLLTRSGEGKYRFDPEASIFIRKMQRAECLRVWQSGPNQ